MEIQQMAKFGKVKEKQGSGDWAGGAQEVVEVQEVKKTQQTKKQKLEENSG